MKQVSVLSLLVIVSGCASANLTAFRDPAYANRQFGKLAVFTTGMYMENAMNLERQVCKKIAPDQCVPGQLVLPPTRSYSTAEISQYLEQADIDGVLIVALGDDQSASKYLGTIATSSATASATQSGTAQVYGNTVLSNSASQGTATASSVATPVYGHSRRAHAIVSLFERRSGGLAWRGELDVSGQGELAVSDDAFIRAATNEIAAKLKASQLVR